MNAGVVCAGELLWDELPGGARLGGAPLNVCAHLRRLGVAARVVTRIGTDPAGGAALERLRELGVPTDGVQRDPALPTGRAGVRLDAAGHADYLFTTPAAFDALEPPPPASPDASPDLLVFGTLAQRDPRARATLRALAAAAQRTVLDLNLRAPHAERDVVSASLRLARIAKLNEDELERCAGWFALPGGLRAGVAALAERFGLEVVCVTRGAAGALLFADGEWHEAAAPAVRVVDTVGAGDAFLAALLEGLLAGRGWSGTLARAVRLGALVAQAPGAVPPYDPAELEAGAARPAGAGDAVR